MDYRLNSNSICESRLPYLTIAQLGHAYRSGILNPVYVTDYLLTRIEKLNDNLGAFVCLTRERALAEAGKAHTEFQQGKDRGALHGIPYATKDLFNVAGESTGAGTRLLKNNISTTDCHVVEKLTTAGMIHLGKTTTTELAVDMLGLQHNQTKLCNPWHPVPHITGGSSCGSAIAVAAGLVPVALGTDTAGSIRVPASLCGIVGFVPTVGRIGRSGVHPLSRTLDSIGPMCRSVHCAASLYQCLSGPDQYDDASKELPTQNVLKEIGDSVKDLYIHYCEDLFFNNIDPQVKTAVRATAKVLSALGAHRLSMKIPEFAQAMAIDDWDCVEVVEGYANNRQLLECHGDQLASEASQLLDGRDFSQQKYNSILRHRKRLQQQLCETLKNVDVVIVPTTVIPAAGQCLVADIDSHRFYTQRYMNNTYIGNFLGLCAISLPCGFLSTGLPIGLMIYAKPFEEIKALRIAHAYECATDWHQQHPDLSHLD